MRTDVTNGPTDGHDKANRFFHDFQYAPKKAEVPEIKHYSYIPK
jgi:hypothetical protein